MIPGKQAIKRHTTSSTHEKTPYELSIDIFGHLSTREFNWESKLVECKLKIEKNIPFSSSHFLLISFVREYSLETCTALDFYSPL